jgi:hypothetical protein
MVHRPGPPLLGLLFLLGALTGMGWAASLETAPAVDPAPPAARPALATAAEPAGARATQIAELARRLPPED